MLGGSGGAVPTSRTRCSGRSAPPHAAEDRPRLWRPGRHEGVARPRRPVAHALAKMKADLPRAAQRHAATSASGQGGPSPRGEGRTLYVASRPLTAMEEIRTAGAPSDRRAARRLSAPSRGARPPPPSPPLPPARPPCGPRHRRSSSRSPAAPHADDLTRRPTGADTGAPSLLDLDAWHRPPLRSAAQPSRSSRLLGGAPTRSAPVRQRADPAGGGTPVPTARHRRHHCPQNAVATPAHWSRRPRTARFGPRSPHPGAHRRHVDVGGPSTCPDNTLELELNADPRHLRVISR
jgi:hypothetical protein